MVGARELGFLGPMPIEDQIDHALGMAGAVTVAPASVVDLGSGGGMPSLVLARHAWPAARWVLVESNKRRASHLDAGVATLGLADRVTVSWSRAEEVGRDAGRRHGFDLVTARSFGPPGVTAECAAPLIGAGGRVLVSEPPGEPDRDRWPAAGLALLGLRVEMRQDTPVHVVVLRAEQECSDRFPRRVGIPTKRPLF